MSVGLIQFMMYIKTRCFQNQEEDTSQEKQLLNGLRKPKMPIHIQIIQEHIILMMPLIQLVLIPFF